MQHNPSRESLYNKFHFDECAKKNCVICERDKVEYYQSITTHTNNNNAYDIQFFSHDHQCSKFSVTDIDKQCRNENESDIQRNEKITNRAENVNVISFGKYIRDGSHV